MAWLAAVVALVACLATPASAQTATGDPMVTGTVSNVTRAEGWSYFTPPPDAGSNPDYTFFANRTDLGASVQGRRFDLSAAFTYVRLENLPSNAIGPGGLGSGAFYFYSAGLRYSYQLAMTGMSARVHFDSGRASVMGGRFRFASGTEAGGDTDVDRLVAARIGSRMIGTFDDALYERRFDGVRVDVDRGAHRFTAALMMPTQGGYEESANLTMPRLQVAAVSWSGRADARAARRWQVFGYGYRDRRPVTVRPDNTGIFFTEHADVTIGTLGGSYVALTPTRAGRTDLVVWGAVQAGDWFGLSHRAASVAVEAGHQWSDVSLRPWLRAGYLFASGDGNGDDHRHGTFFPMVPTAHQYARSAAYAPMNLSDLFVQASIERGEWRARGEWHHLGLPSGNDLWYLGSGATASYGPYFGYSGLRAGGGNRLGDVIEASIDVPIVRHWSLYGYVGRMFGGDVVEHSFTGRQLLTWMAENRLRF